MNFIESIKERAKLDKKTIILPESMDSRVIEAASKILEEDICNLLIQIIIFLLMNWLISYMNLEKKKV